MSSLEKYILSIRDESVMSDEEREKLCRIVFYSRNKENVAKAKDRLIKGHLLLVVSRALHLSKVYGVKEFEIMDLISEGNISLCKAVNSYTMKKNLENLSSRFIGYLVVCIDRNIKRHLGNNRIIRIPDHYYSLIKQMRELKGKYDGNICDKFIGKQMGISAEMVKRINECVKDKILFLEDIFDNIKSWEEIYIKEDDELKDEIGLRSLKVFLFDKMEKNLSAREITVIFLAYFSQTNLSYFEIGKKLKISGERVRQIIAQALRRMKFLLNDESNLQEIGMHIEKEENFNKNHDEQYHWCRIS